SRRTVTPSVRRVWRCKGFAPCERPFLGGELAAPESRGAPWQAPPLLVIGFGVRSSVGRRRTGEARPGQGCAGAGVARGDVRGRELLDDQDADRAAELVHRRGEPARATP